MASSLINRLIAVAQRTKSGELDLSGLELEELPAELQSISDVRVLILRKNQLREIPSWIREFGALRRLDLSDNRFDNFPEEVTALAELQELDLTRNRIEVIPTQVGRLKQLKLLSLQLNKLRVISEAIGEMESLSKLMLHGNSLEYIPESMGTLKRLKELYLNNNCFRAIPAWLGNLESIELLNIQNNKLTAVPPQLEKLDSLRMFFLRDNCFGTVPEVVGRLTKLTYLFLQNTGLESLPGFLSNLTQLSHLFLRGNSLGRIPPVIFSLKSLVNLSIESNGITQIPEELATLPRLEQLNLDNNLVEILPEFLGKLEKLKYLLLRNNRIREVPKALLSVEFQEKLQGLESIGRNLFIAIERSLRVLENIRRDGVWDARIKLLCEAVSRQVEAWDGCFARIIEDHILDCDLAPLFLHDERQSSQNSVERCHGCGMVLTVIQATDIFDGGAATLASDCPGCGPQELSQAGGIRFVVKGEANIHPGKVYGFRVEAKKPSRPSTLDSSRAYIVAQFQDLGGKPFFREIVSTKNGKARFTVPVPPNCSPDMQTLRIAWVQGLTVSALRLQYACVPANSSANLSKRPHRT